MPIVIDPKAYIIGPAFVYYRAVGVTTPWTSAGATLDDAVMRVITEWYRPDNLSGVMGAVMGLDVLRRVDAEIEFTLGEIGGTSLGLAVPGASTTAANGTVLASGHLDTTLDGATVVGATSIEVAAATNAAVGDPIKIDVSTLAEWRVITAINSTTISFRDPLILAHASGVAVEEAESDNRALIEAPTLRRQPDSAYREWAIVSESGNGYHELRIPRGISQTETVEMTVADDAVAGIRVTIGARYLGSDLTQSPFKLYVPAAAA